LQLWDLRQVLRPQPGKPRSASFMLVVCLLGVKVRRWVERPCVESLPVAMAATVPVLAEKFKNVYRQGNPEA
jgi:hypothetical protein